jgi:hypothetical protein
MATIHLHQTTTATPEQFLAGLTDFGPGRSKIWGNSADWYLTVHSQGPTEADVTQARRDGCSRSCWRPGASGSWPRRWPTA